MSMRSMKAPGSPSSPLQSTYWRARGLPHEAPFGPRGKAGPASAPQPALTDFLDHVGRLHRFQASPQGREAAAGQVLVKVQRIAAAEMLGGDMDLRPEEGRHVRLLRPHGMGLRRHSRRIVKETIERPGDKAAEARADAAGPKMPRDQGLSGRGGDVRVDLVARRGFRSRWPGPVRTSGRRPRV